MNMFAKRHLDNLLAYINTSQSLEFEYLYIIACKLLTSVNKFMKRFYIHNLHKANRLENLTKIHKYFVYNLPLKLHLNTS